MAYLSYSCLKFPISSTDEREPKTIIGGLSNVTSNWCLHISFWNHSKWSGGKKQTAIEQESWIMASRVAKKPVYWHRVRNRMTICHRLHEAWAALAEGTTVSSMLGMTREGRPERQWRATIDFKAYTSTTCLRKIFTGGLWAGALLDWCCATLFKSPAMPHKGCETFELHQSYKQRSRNPS